MRVRAYYNLHHGCWSVQALEGRNKGRVIAHARAVKLEDFVTKVSQAGRERVLKERKKNVHAFIEGNLKAASGWIPKRLDVVPDTYDDRDLEVYHDVITYNPYKFDCFVEVGNEDLRVSGGYLANLSSARKVYVLDHETHRRAPDQLELFA